MCTPLRVRGQAVTDSVHLIDHKAEEKRVLEKEWLLAERDNRS